ncbi:MAG: response regulator [Phycisphaerales bacterium]|nr:response regulator [Phycisphaerales bacterium]
MPANVLIVDDSRTMRRMVKKTLAMAGLDFGEVFEAGNGIEALAQLHSHDIGVVLLDINMPLMNGMQFLQRIRDDVRLRNTPVVIASTEGSETRIRELMEMGAKGYVRKPFQPETLRNALVPIIGERENAMSDLDSTDADDAF